MTKREVTNFLSMTNVLTDSVANLVFLLVNIINMQKRECQEIKNDVPAFNQPNQIKKKAQGFPLRGVILTFKEKWHFLR